MNLPPNALRLNTTPQKSYQIITPTADLLLGILQAGILSLLALDEKLLAQRNLSALAAFSLACSPRRS